MLTQFNASFMIPTVFEEERGGVKVYYDLFSRLLKDRIVFVVGPIDMRMASIVVAQLLYLEKENSKGEIQMYISSPGGNVEAGFAILDTMNYIAPDIVTIGLGQVASFAAILLSAGTKGKRFLLPNTKVMIHQPWLTGLGSVDATQLKITADLMSKLKVQLVEILAKNTGKSKQRILKDVERDFWMSAREALSYGLVDKILSK